MRKTKSEKKRTNAKYSYSHFNEQTVNIIFHPAKPLLILPNFSHEEDIKPLKTKTEPYNE